MAESLLSGVLVLKVRLDSGEELEIACPFELEALRLVYQGFKSEEIKKAFHELKELCIEFLREFEEGEELLEIVENVKLEESGEELSSFVLKYVTLVQEIIENGKELEGEAAKAYYHGVIMPYIRALNFAIVNNCKEPEYLWVVRWLLKLARRVREARRPIAVKYAFS